MHDSKNGTAEITGAASGIGLAPEPEAIRRQMGRQVKGEAIIRPEA